MHISKVPKDIKIKIQISKKRLIYFNIFFPDMIKLNFQREKIPFKLVYKPDEAGFTVSPFTTWYLLKTITKLTMSE